jgi:hypothetical protein
MWIVSEQPICYPLKPVKSASCSCWCDTAVRYLHTWLLFSKVVEKKEENAVINRNRVFLSINPILIH